MLLMRACVLDHIGGALVGPLSGESNSNLAIDTERQVESSLEQKNSKEKGDHRMMVAQIKVSKDR